MTENGAHDPGSFARGRRPVMTRGAETSSLGERATDGDATSFPSLGRHPKMKDIICQTLREWIVFGDATPGDRLVETDLAARFNVSKTPVREALLTLEAEGLVTLRPHRGAEISRLSLDEWRDLICLRDAIEVGALDDIVASMTAAHFEAAERCLADMETAFNEGDYRHYRQAQRRLHATILGALGRPSVPETAVQLNDRLDRYGRILTTRDPGGWARDLAMNRQRLELIRTGDTATYTRLIRGRHAEATAMLTQEYDLGDVKRGGTAASASNRSRPAAGDATTPASPAQSR
jgi:DNA-binding GntR family transcriptional regulator